MTIRPRSVFVLLAACLMLAFAGVASAQQYSVVAVMPDGTVVLNGPTGVKSYAVPPGTTFNADGQAGVSVADLKPGMKVSGMESGLASWKTTDVMVHQELNAKVMAIAGNSMLIRGSKGVEKYEWKDASDITIVKDGKVVDASVDPRRRSDHRHDRSEGRAGHDACPGRGRPEAGSGPGPQSGAGARADGRSGCRPGSGPGRSPGSGPGEEAPEDREPGSAGRSRRPARSGGRRGPDRDPQVALGEVTRNGSSRCARRRGGRNCFRAALQ